MKKVFSRGLFTNRIQSNDVCLSGKLEDKQRGRIPAELFIVSPSTKIVILYFFMALLIISCCKSIKILEKVQNNKSPEGAL